MRTIVVLVLVVGCQVDAGAPADPAEVTLGSAQQAPVEQALAARGGAGSGAGTGSALRSMMQGTPTAEGVALIGERAAQENAARATHDAAAAAEKAAGKYLGWDGKERPCDPVDEAEQQNSKSPGYNPNACRKMDRMAQVAFARCGLGQDMGGGGGSGGGTASAGRGEGGASGVGR